MSGLGYVGGFLMGIVLGLMGAGGSILTVPILVYGFGILPERATGASLFVVCVVSILGMLGYLLKKQVRFLVAVMFATPAMLSVYGMRSYLVPKIPDPLSVAGLHVSKSAFIMLLFSGVMGLASFSMIRGQKISPMPNPSGLPKMKIVLLGTLVGALSGLLGAGGGFLIIPALVLFAHLPMKEAVGTSLLIIALNTGVGFLGELGMHHKIEWPFLIVFTAVAALGMVAGVTGSRYVSNERLKPLFGWFILVVAVSIFFQETVNR